MYKKVQTEEDTILNNSAYSILYSVCDENGEPMFTEADLPQIAQIDAGTVGELMDAIKKVNRFDEDEAELEKKLITDEKRRFLFKLAGHLGKTVGELEATMSASELSEWLAYDRLDPIGGYRGDIQAATIAASMGGGKLSDYLIIDPNPMTDEQRQEYEYYQRLAELEDEQSLLIERFNHLEDAQ